MSAKFYAKFWKETHNKIRNVIDCEKGIQVRITIFNYFEYFLSHFSGDKLISVHRNVEQSLNLAQLTPL